MNMGMDGTVVGFIRESSDYSWVRFMGTNRPVKDRKGLIASIKKFGQLKTVIVNELGEIVDGQHRFSVLRELGLPFRYEVRVGARRNEVLELNTTGRVWGSKDYFESHREKGAYQQLRVFQQQSGLGLPQVQVLLKGKEPHCFKRDFQNGTFEITESDERRFLTNVEKFLSVYRLQPSGYTKSESWGSKVGSIRVLVTLTRLFEHPRYNHNHFLRRLEGAHRPIRSWHTTADTAAGILEIYNSGLRANKIEKLEA